MIVVENLHVTYPSGRKAVDGVSLSVPGGQVLALLGGNGAGKSTTMKVAAGVVAPSQGRVLIDGSPTHGPSGDQARAVTGYCPDVGGLPAALSVRECIGLALAATGQLELWPQAYKLAEALDLTRVLDELTGTFSHGMSRRTSVLLALLGARKVLLLDEPFDGVDPHGVRVICEAIALAKGAGLAVIVSTHLLDVARKVADRAVVMQDGKVSEEGTPHEVTFDLDHAPALAPVGAWVREVEAA